MAYVGHTFRVFGLTLIFSLRFFFRRRGDFDSGPGLLRHYLQDCGGAFIKVGQLLAMRYDLLPTLYCDELGQLLDRLPPLPVETILQVVSEDLKRPWSSVFKEFISEPIGSASVAQVHRAVLNDGSLVAVKVLRPGIESCFQVDFRNIRLIAGVVDMLGILGNIALSELAFEFIQLTRQEFDFRREARSIQHLHDLMEQDGLNHCAPCVHFIHSSAHIITMELFEGIWLHEILAAVANHDRERLSLWAEHGIVPNEVGCLILRSVLTQCYRHRFFHADPHAGNLIIMEGGRLGFIDFGVVGWLDEQLWEQQFRLYESLANARIHSAYEAILSMMGSLPQANVSRFEVETKSLLQDWIMIINSPNSTPGEKSSGIFFLRLLDIVRRSGLSVPTGIMKLNRALIISDVAIMKLSPDMNRLTFLKEFFSEEVRHLRNVEITEQLSSDVLNRAMVEVIRSPFTAWSLLDWAVDNVPAIWRDNRQTLSRRRNAPVGMLRHVRLVSMLIVLVALVKVIDSAIHPSSIFTQFVASVESSWWIIGLVASCATIFLWWLIDIFASHDRY